GRDRSPRLPSPETFGILAGNLGIGNRSHVAIVNRGETVGDTAVAAQIYWTFRVMGHDAGFRDWEPDADNPIERRLNPDANS
ncbi:MAG: hypothetical protein WD407_05825, partial [Rhodospirillales bacterium]